MHNDRHKTLNPCKQKEKKFPRAKISDIDVNLEKKFKIDIYGFGATAFCEIRSYIDLKNIFKMFMFGFDWSTKLHPLGAGFLI